MSKRKLYPYGDIPSPEVVERFKEKKRPISDESEHEANYGNGILPSAEEMERMYQSCKDWTAVYAMLNID